MMAVMKDFTEKIVVDHKTDFISHFYFILLEIWELDTQSKRLDTKSRVVNVYNNKVERDCT